MGKSSLASIFNSRARSREDIPTVVTPVAKSVADTSCLGEEQKHLFGLMEQTDSSMFITGKAGTGKSHLLEFFIQNTSKNVAVLASTGVAALNVGGQTIHSFFRIPPSVPVPEDDLEPVESRKRIYRCLDAIVIDEVSMISPELMNAIDQVLRNAVDKNVPFGGKQMLLFGDLYQLPPVAGPQEKRYFDDRYGGSFFFNAPGVKEGNLHIHEMNHVYRQRDPKFIEILNGIRDGSISDEDLALLNERANVSADGDMAIVIAPTNDAVSAINESMLDSLDEPLYVYESTIEGSIGESAFPVPAKLELKVGARVMMLRNDFNSTSMKPEEGRRWANGTLGQVSKLTEDFIWVMVNGVSHQINRASWKKLQYEYDVRSKRLKQRQVAELEQFPVKLSWAVTVHKSQGATYQSVGIDMAEGMFAEGQMYVALSRCADMNHLYLSRPITRDDIKTSDEVRAFMMERGRKLASSSSRRR